MNLKIIKSSKKSKSYEILKWKDYRLDVEMNRLGSFNIILF